MSSTTKPSDLPPLPDSEGYTAALRLVAEYVNGFVYEGDRLNAVIDTIKVLRANRSLARRLLEIE